MPYKEVTGTLTDIGTEERAQKRYRYFFLPITMWNFPLSYILLATIICSNPTAWNLDPDVTTDFRTSLQVTRVPFLSLPLSCACCCALLDNSALRFSGLLVPGPVRTLSRPPVLYRLVRRHKLWCSLKRKSLQIHCPDYNCMSLCAV